MADQDQDLVDVDPIHLIRLFGISEVTAVRYVHAAHPERTAKSLR